MATILVLVHTHDRFLTRHFMVKGLFETWIQAGHKLRVHQGAEGAPPADVAILHVDLTVVPEPYLEALKSYPVVINGRIADIGKRRWSANLVALGDGYAGPVIVKTNLNGGGVPEWNHQQIDLQHGKRPAAPVRVMTKRYPIFASPALVPPAVWRDRDLVVEKFLPEQDERGYYLRNWIFFGDRERCNRALGKHPVVKASDAMERVPVPVPDEMRALRESFGFDFGKFDFVIHEGKPVLLDINRTPVVPANLSAAIQAGNAHLAEGMAAFLR